MFMTNRESGTDLCQLDRTYRKTWEQFCIEVAVLHSLLTDPRCEAIIEGARNRVADAERSYRDSRDRLAQHMIGNIASGLARLDGLAGDAGAPESNEEERPWTRQVRLERLAYQFWEDGGRRDGNADADWYRAEALLRG